MVHVNLKSCKKHEIQYANFSENLKTAVSIKYVEPIRPDDHTGNDHTHNVRNPEPVQQYRSKQDYRKNDKEYRYR